MISKEGMQYIDLESILDFNDVDIFLGGGPLAQILPEEGKEEEVPFIYILFHFNYHFIWEYLEFYFFLILRIM